MELFTLFGKIATNGDEARRDIERTTNAARSAESPMMGTFKKIGGAIVAAFAVEKIIEFGKNMVEVTAKVQALDSQFQQTFKGEQTNAMEKINKQAQEQGIHVDRLKGTWASFYGTFRGNGADANKSLELTQKYMSLAGDASAYYDLGLEDVASRLKSITMGNYEAGDAIGININATKLDTIAKEKYGKKLQDLTDTEKEYLILDTASKIYENNGAMGQGAREANNYTNVVANLKSTWERFLSIIGAPVLQVVIIVIKGITDGIQALVNILNTYDIGGSFLYVLSNMFSGQFYTDIQNSILSIKTLIKVITGDFMASFEPLKGSLENFGLSLMAVLQPIIENGVPVLLNLFGALLYSLDVVLPVVMMLYTVIYNLISEILQAAAPAISAMMVAFGDLANAIITFWTANVLPVISSFISMMATLYAENQDKLSKIGELFNIIFNLIAFIIQGAINNFKTTILPFFIWFVSIVQSNLGNIKQFFQGALTVIGGIIDIFIGLFTGDWSRMWEGVKAVCSGAWNMIKAGFSAFVSVVRSICSGIFEALSAPFRNAYDTISGIIGRIKSAVSNMFTGIKIPHIGVSVGWGGPDDKIPYPKFNVSWNAEGAIFTKPTIFNTPQGLQGVGEAGAEAVLPISKLEVFIYNGFMKAIEDSGLKDVSVNMDGKAVGKILAPTLNTQLANLGGRKSW